MSLPENCGHIFNSEELLYMLKQMGVNYAVGIDRNEGIRSEKEIMDSLIEKDYIHKGLDGEYIFSADIVRLLEPIAKISGFISLKYGYKDNESTMYFYVGKNGFTVSDVNSSSALRYVLTFDTKKEKIYDLIKEKREKYKGEKTDFDITMSSELFKKITEENENAISEAGLDEKGEKLVRAIAENKYYSFSMTACRDIKNHPADMSYYIFAVTEYGMVRIEFTGKNVHIYSVISIDIENSIHEMMTENMKIKPKETIDHLM